MTPTLQTPLHSSSLTAALFLLSFALPAFGADLKPVLEASPALLKLLSIAEVKPGEVGESLNLSARVELDQHRVARIGASVTGRITEIDAMLGQAVKKGERLALLNSTELGKAQSDYLKAASQVNLRRITVKRAERLLESGVIAEAEFQERQSVLTEADVDLRAASDQLRVMGMSEADLKRLDKQRSIHSYSPVTASIDGVVIERNVAIGQVVQPADALYTVADLSQLWLVAEIPEQQAHWARQGDQAFAEVPALPGQEVSGKLIYVADMVDSDTRTVTVRMALANPQRLFKPQMLATLKISKPGSQTLIVPSQAVVRENDKDFVFVDTGSARFELRPVRLGREEAQKRPLLEGLKAGEKIVVGGAFHLNNERLRSTLE
ncbi:efflux RND transporter periplasmic adaptor subunit [Methylomonas sp. MO1]|uniref:efflux RND transporter periplasmic adaptor subunit n=1 Tax=unclassified Methylomonas TaxID=2608980 RepID=UPI0006841746|nr:MULTISPECIES: efflux RND transporter periplasmic adaptor subunit [unclassified Methylomonas]MDT4289631.1 efflux RND transporter periplasmic adaptor subunit [Methylomonas sp. MO1]